MYRRHDAVLFWTKKMETTVELRFGFTDKKGVVHRDVTFGKRPTLADFVLLETDPLSANNTQREMLVRKLMITKFGTLKCPLAPNVLASLDTLDDDKLRSAGNQFLFDSREGREHEYLEENAFRLMFPIEINGATYDTVKFGRRLMVSDNIEADRLKLGDGIARAAFQICRQVVEISDSESGLKIDGQPTPDQLSGMDAEDFTALRFAAEFFRLGVADAKPESGTGENGDGNSEANGLVGNGDPSDAAPAV